MAEVKKINFANSEYQFDAFACDCKINTEYLSKDKTTHIFSLFPKDEKHYFAYMAEKGLISLPLKGSYDGKAVMPELLGIKEGDVNSVAKFIQEHGFLLPLCADKNNQIKSDLFFGLIKRLKATIELIASLGNGKNDYAKIVSLTLYLLLSPQMCIELTTQENPFYTCDFQMSYIWNNVDEINELKIMQEDVNYSIKDGLYIEDSVRPPQTFLTDNDYCESMGYGACEFKNIKNKTTFLFRNAIEATPDCRLAIDFIYHFCEIFGDIKKYNHTGDLVLEDDRPETYIKIKDELDEQLQTALINLAKRTLKEEIEWNLCGVAPTYDTESMGPTWKVEHLLSGLYLSIFYMRPNLEIYRTCANPTCGKQFLVKTTSKKKKYCSIKCTNAMSQRTFRHKKAADISARTVDKTNVETA